MNVTDLTWKIMEKEIDEAKPELASINDVADPEQQGYLVAPIMRKIARLSAKELMVAVIESQDPHDHPDNKQRDAGVIRWCKEQIENEV